jgi:hypothetical protein
MASTRVQVALDNLEGWLKAKETVVLDTPACSAISWMVIRVEALIDSMIWPTGSSVNRISKPI